MIHALDSIGERDYADSASRFWLASTRPDGGPHLMAVAIVWDGGRFHLCTGAEPRRAATSVVDLDRNSILFDEHVYI